MQMMKDIYEENEEIGVFNFSEYKLNQITAFIKLMNDDLLTSELTNSDYESLAKNNA